MGNQHITALIDADSIVWIVAYNCRDTKDLKPVYSQTDSFIRNLLERVNARMYAGWYGIDGDKTSYRRALATIKPYKGTRTERPEWYTLWAPHIKQRMTDKWGFVGLVTIEADDAVSITGRNIMNSVICGADKDLLQIPGNHFHYKKHEFSYSDEYKTAYCLAYQMLVGDDTDNIEGVKGIGPKTADKLLDTVPSHKLFEIVRLQYDKKYKDAAEKHFNENYALLKLLEGHEPLAVEAGYTFAKLEAHIKPYKNLGVVPDPPEEKPIPEKKEPPKWSDLFKVSL